MNELKTRTVTFGFSLLPGCNGRNCMYGFFFTCILFFGLMAVATPASAATWTLNPGESIEGGISLASPGDTLVLNPGTYFQHTIEVLWDIRIISNSTAGGNAGNTIIDATDSGGIFYDNTSAGCSLTIEGLTLKNGSTDLGGAVCVVNGTVSITSSIITDCYASDDGGAIYSENVVDAVSCDFTDCSTGIAGAGGAITSSIVTVTSCTFTDCGSAVCMGGAIASDDVTAVSCSFTGCQAFSGGGICSPAVSLTSCTFTNCRSFSYGGGVFCADITTISCTFTGCTAVDDGGGIYSGDVTVTSCTFTECSANGGGGISSINANVTSSTFDGCYGTGGYSNGGAICSDYITGGTFLISSSTFTDCQASAGGAMYFDFSGITVNSCTFTNCRGTDSGGAILSFDNNYLNIDSGTFTNCSALNYAGAVLSDTNSVTFTTITSSTFSGCSAENMYGGVLYSNSSVSTIHYSRIYDCNVGTAVVMENGTLDAENNWWGTNSDPSVYTAALSGGPVDVTPWLVLDATVNSPVIKKGGASPVAADLTFNSDGQDTSAGGHVPDGIPVAFAITGGPGSLSSLVGTTTSGLSITTYTSSSTGTATISATVDDQTSGTSIEIISTGGSSSVSGGSNTDTGIGFAENLKAGQSATFNMNKGAVYRVVLTAGTDIDKLMIAVIREESLPSSVDRPGTDVYEFEDVILYYADDSDLSGRTLYFKVKKSWLSPEGYGMGDVVMLHYNDETGVWEELETTLTGEDGTYYYYSADTSSFSFFAIAIVKDRTIIPEETATAAPTAVLADSSPVHSAAPASSGIQVTQPSPEEGPSLSLILISGLFLFLIGIIVAGLISRRRADKYPDWWDHGRK